MVGVAILGLVMSPKEKRKAARVSQLQIAALAKCALPTVRLYEASPDAVSEEKRVDLDRVYESLRPVA